MELNEKDLELVRKPNFGHASTVRRDGAPSSAVVWIHERDGTVWFNSTSSSAKIKYLRRDPRAAISVHDQDNPYVAVTFLGTAELSTEGADEDVDVLTRKYTGMERFPNEWRVAGDVRVTVSLRPSAVARYGY